MSASRYDARRAVVDQPTASPSDGAPVLAEPVPADDLPPDDLTGGGMVTAPRRGARWLRKHWQWPVAVAMLGLAYLSLRGHLPSVHAVIRAADTAHPLWIVIAAACEVVSLGAFARQQRSLLGAVGVRMSTARALGVTYARSALAFSMPAGSAVSAGFAFQQYRRSGASNDKAAAVTVLSGVLSFLGIAVLYVTGTLGALMAEPAETAEDHPVLLAAVLTAVLLAGSFWVWRRHVRSAGQQATAPSASRAGGAAGWSGTVRRGLADTIEAWRSIRARDWSRAGAFAIFNWLLDLLCLVAAARAFHLTVGVGTVAAVYLGAQIIRQIPLTPGGIGLIETTLLTGLVSAGAGAGEATAAILAYRILSCWLIIPIGGLAYLGLRRSVRLAPAED